MERFLKQYDKERMKMAMLKHEETFRQQVHELHRLYRVQKILMSDLKIKELKREQRWRGMNETGFDRSHYCYQEERRRIPRQFDLEQPAEEYIEGEDRNGMIESDDENYLELTLATGRSRRKKDERSYTSDSGTSFSSSSSESGRIKLNGFEVEGGVREDRMKQYPPWLFQCLSLNMT
ncbi:Sterile alpha motif/pointed domain-containing protein [Dioscorea alata]|nr:Sterile alpha motif/pointed domain-containing protein [Dioscorea alata]KAH7652486.1 Sterile alpha motif/pointed domain-containing protein [Dioscorea alata]